MSYKVHGWMSKYKLKEDSLMLVIMTYLQHGGTLCTGVQLLSQHKTTQGLTGAPSSVSSDRNKQQILFHFQEICQNNKWNGKKMHYPWTKKYPSTSFRKLKYIQTSSVYSSHWYMSMNFFIHVQHLHIEYTFLLMSWLVDTVTDKCFTIFL